eukprot:CAMPEP_0116874534 /NCGR_PEP_ID=MMETSP0463-20121206/5999_1 /TAXON_ID=181622 /ORGANISM="Strombidinopsis sp, Strain SopsisLIS2011" /LENGTH=54 /DNA_ID=CAMNT_0004518281 /DNA_START=3395 /DNA_END=3559 /DNA_ORIENTATION=-
MAGSPLDILIASIICMNMIIKKYRFANFVKNCWNKLRGKKFKNVYFDVFTVFPL